MEQDTNVAMDMNNGDGSNLFADWDTNNQEEAEEQIEQKEDTEHKEPKTEKAESEPANEPIKYKVKFLGEEKELEPDELITWAQKGMNADHKIAQYENSREIQLLDKLAAKLGVNRAQYLDMIERKSKDTEAKESAEEFTKKYPDIPKAAAEEYAKLALKLKEKEIKEAETAKEIAEREQREKPLREFVEYLNENHPNEEYTRDTAKLPKEVIEAIKAGKDPTRAFMTYELSEAKTKIKELTEKLELSEKTEKKNKENKTTTVGSVSSNTGEQPNDPFLSGLLGG